MKTIKYSVMLMFLAGTVYSQVPSRIDEATYQAEKARLDKITSAVYAGGIKNMTQAKAIQYMNCAWRFFEMGCAGHDESLAYSAIRFYNGAEHCRRVCSNTRNSGNGVNYEDYRQMYVSFGRVAGIREIINKTSRGRAKNVIWNGNFYGKLASNYFYDMQKGHRFNNVSREQLWKWFAEGHQEVIGEWNALN